LLITNKKETNPLLEFLSNLKHVFVPGDTVFLVPLYPLLFVLSISTKFYNEFNRTLSPAYKDPHVTRSHVRFIVSYIKSLKT
jgi:hypothetical protein